MNKWRNILSWDLLHYDVTTPLVQPVGCLLYDGHTNEIENKYAVIVAMTSISNVGREPWGLWRVNSEEALEAFHKFKTSIMSGNVNHDLSFGYDSEYPTPQHEIMDVVLANSLGILTAEEWANYLAGYTPEQGYYI